MDDITVTPALQTTINNAIEVRGQFAAIGNFRSTLNNGIFVFAFTIPLGWLISYLRLIQRGVVIAQTQTAIHTTFTGLIDSPERELSPDELEQLAALLLAHYDSVTHTYDFHGIITSEDFPDANTPLGIALRRAAINRLIEEIQLYVSENFIIDNIEQMADEAVNASFLDLLQIWQILLDCGNCNVDEFNGVDNAQNLQYIANLAFVTDDTPPTPLLYAPNVETALQAILVPAIQLAVGTAITDTTYTLNAAAITISRLAAINVTLQTHAPNYTLSAIITALDIENIPEVEAPLRTEWIEDLFDVLKTALQGVESATEANLLDISTEVTAYRNALQNAYGVTFDSETNADDWNLVSIHFVRLALDATSRAFANWLTNFAAGAGITNAIINRFLIFRNVMGSINFRNVEDIVPSAFAETQQRQEGARIVVFRRDATRQAIMTPNNSIHELGHALDGRAGFGFKKLGSIEETKRGDSNVATEFSRDGMGASYLRVQYYEHRKLAQTTDAEGNTIAEFILIDNDYEPLVAVPEQYLMFDLFEYNYFLWNDADFNIYRIINDNVRIDTFAQNPDTTDLETVADGFLSWVRGAFEGETGQHWRNMFNANMGMFLRNAAIYTKGMLQYYQGWEVVPLSPLDTGQVRFSNYKLRLTPEELEIVNVNQLAETLPSSVNIYGWLDVEGFLSDGLSSYWILVAQQSNRLLWIASYGVIHDTNIVTSQPEADVAYLRPDRDFDANDLSLITGMAIE